MLTLYFVPAANFNGDTNFTYAAKDDAGAADASPVNTTINITLVYDAPTTNHVSASGAEDAASIIITGATLVVMIGTITGTTGITTGTALVVNVHHGALEAQLGKLTI